jgi:glycosyltransferase involved in cell wall biosynthesis
MTKLSVIVCTRNRAHAIIPCLDSITQSLTHAAPVDAEIVVVDNASTDDTSAVVREWAKSCAFPVQLLFEPRKGLSAARNCALRSARGDLLAFTDDDCRVSKEYAANLLRHDTTDTEPVLRGGRVELDDPTDLPVTIKTDVVLARWNRQMNSAKRYNLGNCIFGCNMSMRRTVVERLGYFDELLGAGTSIPGGEDTDFIFRAYLAGLTIEYVPDMVVFHRHGRKLISDGNRLFRNYCIGGGALYAKYFFKNPDLCRQFYWDARNAVREIFAGKNTYMPDLNFSHKDKVIYYILGTAKYYLALAKITTSISYPKRKIV